MKNQLKKICQGEREKSERKGWLEEKYPFWGEGKPKRKGLWGKV